MEKPKITVVIPVYNRVKELQRALRSIQEQTLKNFECIVIDDASTVPIEPIIMDLNDSRFVYKINKTNGGPYNARTLGYRFMKGEYLFHLDSDDEAYPWALARAAMYLDDTPEVDAVAGLNLRNHDSKLFVRVKEGKKIITPKDYVKMPKVPDCVGAIRRKVVYEWLQKRDDYFALESHVWFTFGLKHKQLYVDEPWSKINTVHDNRVSNRVDNRILDDYPKFILEHEKIVEKVDCVYLNTKLPNMWRQLLKAGRKKEAKMFEKYLILKKIKYKKSLVEKVNDKIKNKWLLLINHFIKMMKEDSTYYI